MARKSSKTAAKQTKSRKPSIANVSRKGRKPTAKQDVGEVVAQAVKTFLLNPVYTYKPNGKVDTITGQCAEEGCTNTRTIHSADAFQVSRCVECQKRYTSRRLTEKRRVKRQLAKAEAAQAERARRDATKTHKKTRRTIRQEQVADTVGEATPTPAPEAITAQA